MNKLQSGDVIQILAKKDGVSKGKYYLVANAEMGGGCDGHDPYPDGWQLALNRLDDDLKWSPNTKKSALYQDGYGGCFTTSVVLKEGEFVVVGRMEMKWELVSKVQKILL